MQTVLAEFDTGSVTSPSSENGAYLPLDFIRAANVAGSYEEGLVSGVTQSAADAA